MIVADTNLIAYLYLPGKQTSAAEELLLRDDDWAVPRLWRSEFRNILATYMRQGLLELSTAEAIFGRAEALLGANEYDVTAREVLRLAKESRCSAYDCEFVALAQYLGTKLVSADAKLRKAFPAWTVALSEV